MYINVTTHQAPIGEMWLNKTGSRKARAMAKWRTESWTGIWRRGQSTLVYTGSKVIKVVELESKLHSQQWFLNPHKYSETVSPDFWCYYVKLTRPSLRLALSSRHPSLTNKSLLIQLAASKLATILCIAILNPSCQVASSNVLLSSSSSNK